MIVNADVTIDLDEKRRVWVQISAEGDGDPTQELIENLAKGAAKGALDAYSQAVRRQTPDAPERRMQAGRDPDRPKPIGVK